MIRHITAVLLILSSITTVPPLHAKELPQGEFLVLGPVFPGIQAGEIVPVFANARISDDQIHWSFTTPYAGDNFSCDRSGKCKRTVQTLTHKVSWGTDGTLKILDTNRIQGDGLQVDRGEDIHVYGALEGFLKGANLSLTARGGEMIGQTGRRASTRKVTLHPMTLQQFHDGLAFVMSFEESLGRMNHCAIRQYADILNAPNPSQIETEILAAVRYFGKWQAYEDVGGFYLQGTAPAEKAAAVELAYAKATLMGTIVTLADAFMPKGAEPGSKQMTDDAIWAALTKELQAPFVDQFEAIAPGFLTEITTTLKAEIIAAIKHQNRVNAVYTSGEPLLDAICRDVRLPAR